jgi:protein TonB
VVEKPVVKKPVEVAPPPPPPPPPPVVVPPPVVEKPVEKPVERPIEKPVRPKGPSREAEASHQVAPEIPDELKHSNFKSFVRVKVEIDEDGNFTPILRTSSGNPEIDQRVLDALKRWRWKPALKDGAPVKSTQLFKFDIEVR